MPKNILRVEQLPEDIDIRYESSMIADVVCSRCHTEIGRLQTVSAEPDADMEEIYAEIRMIADEHKLACIET